MVSEESTRKSTSLTLVSAVHRATLRALQIDKLLVLGARVTCATVRALNDAIVQIRTTKLQTKRGNAIFND